MLKLRGEGLGQRKDTCMHECAEGCFRRRGWGCELPSPCEWDGVTAVELEGCGVWRCGLANMVFDIGIEGEIVLGVQCCGGGDIDSSARCKSKYLVSPAYLSLGMVPA